MNHKEISSQLSIFAFSENVGKGLPLYLPNGAIIKDELMSYLKKIQFMLDYQMVSSPHIALRKLYEISGHYEKYKEDSFGIMLADGEEYMLKAMNCPHHCEIYKSSPRSYRDLPLRFSEFGQVYRYEDSGALNGLLRARGFCQDDAHIFCRHDQVESEIANVIKLVKFVLNKFNFEDISIKLSFRDESDKYIGSIENWQNAEKALISVCDKYELAYEIARGDAAFYGPKIDFVIQDSLDRSWQLGTVQLDYNLPERFELAYVNQMNELDRPVMIHRAPFGSLERFIAILLEQSNLPLWLSPLQVSVIPIADRHIEGCKNVEQLLKRKMIRAKVDESNERMQKKILNAVDQRVPYMIVVGDKEIESGILSVRINNSSVKMDIDAFVKLFQDRIAIEQEIDLS